MILLVIKCVFALTSKKALRREVVTWAALLSEHAHHSLLDFTCVVGEFLEAILVFLCEKGATMLDYNLCHFLHGIATPKVQLLPKVECALFSKLTFFFSHHTLVYMVICNTDIFFTCPQRNTM